MDNKMLPSGRKPSPRSRRLKNIGFIALILLFVVIIFTAYNQPNNLQEVSASSAVSQTNAGDYSKILVSGNELQITPKGQNHPTLKTFVDPNASLKDQGFNLNKVSVNYKSSSSGSSDLISLAGSVIPVVLIGGLLYFMLRSAQGQGNQAL